MSPDRATLRATRTIALAFAAILGLAALLALAAPRAAAAPAAPYFGPNVRVDAPPAYTAYQPSLAVGSDGVAYLAYAGWAGSPTGVDLFFSKSTDGGRTWSLPFRVNNDGGGATQQDPSIALDADNAIYIAWTDNRGGNNDIYFSLSTDGGLSFSANVRVNDMTTNTQSESDIVVDAQGLVHVVWTDYRTSAISGPDIYYANSTDGGLSFNPSQRINNDATGAEQARPAIAVAADRSVYVVWEDPRNGARGRDIYFSKSTDLGDTWTPNVQVNDDVGNYAQTDPTIAVNATGGIFIAWADGRTPNTAPDLYATRSANAGSSFAANVKVNDEAGSVWQGQPSFAVNGELLYLVWTDARTVGSTAYDIYAASSLDGLTWSLNVKVNDDTLSGNWQQSPTVAIDALGNVFAAWFDMRASGQDVYAGTLDVIRPTANAGGDRAIGQGGSTSFDGSASTDNFGIASYAWDFGDGASAVGMTASHAYPAPGTYIATLIVWDYSGNAATDTVQVTVRDTEAPVPRGGGDRVVDEGQPLFFDASASTDNVGIASYAWDFGDDESSTDPAVSHVYGAPGTYTVTLTVTDAAGNAATATMTVTVRPVSPKASELLGMIQGLQVLVAILGIALLLVGLLAFLGWRRRRQPPVAAPPSMPPAPQPPAQMPGPPPMQPAEQDPLDAPLPSEDGSKAT